MRSWIMVHRSINIRGKTCWIFKTNVFIVWKFVNGKVINILTRKAKYDYGNIHDEGFFAALRTVRLQHGGSTDEPYRLSPHRPLVLSTSVYIHTAAHAHSGAARAKWCYARCMSFSPALCDTAPATSSATGRGTRRYPEKTYTLVVPVQL